MYKKVLVANRGMIQAACVRAIKSLGASAAVICEEGDFNLAGVREADKVFVLGTNIPYLNVDAVVNAAVEFGADAVHPGYGFLAESVELAKKLQEKGIAFIASNNLLKGGVMPIEAAPENSRLINIPVLRDNKGKYLIFPEQECPVKLGSRVIFAESPSPSFTKDIAEKAVGMIPEILEKRNIIGYADFEFAISNGKLQFLGVKENVQHFYVIASIMTGVDVLREQIKLHSGEQLSLTTKDLLTDNVVLAVNINAMNCYNKFTVQVGKIERMYFPYSENALVQTPFVSGDNISEKYESALAKIVVHAKTREEAFKNLSAYLENMNIEGIKTTLPLLRGLLNCKDLVNGNWTISRLSKDNSVKEILDTIHTEENESIAALTAALSLSVDKNFVPTTDNNGVSLWNTASKVLNTKKMKF